MESNNNIYSEPVVIERSTGTAVQTGHTGG